MKKILLYLFCSFFYSSLFSQEELPTEEVFAPSSAELTYFFYGISVAVSFICVSLLLRMLRRGLRVDSYGGID